MNYQDLQIDFLCEIEQISELTFSNGYGDHPVAFVKGIVDEKKHGEMLQAINEETPFTIKKKDGTVIFAGFASDVKFVKEDSQYVFQLTAKGATAKMDVLKRSRTFFKKGITYQEIIDRVVGTYPGAVYLPNVNLSKATDFPIIQYKETDWEFISRLASLFGAVLLPVENSLTPRFEIGCAKRKAIAQITVAEDEMERDLLDCEKDFYLKDTCLAAQDNTETFVSETVSYPNVLNYTTKIFTLRDYYPAGTVLRINGVELTVSYVEAYLDKGDLLFDYVARLSDGIKTVYLENEELAGASLTGTVKQRVGNTVSLTLDIDQDDGIAGDGEDYFFAYAIETKAYYCMPVEGAKVHLYFPSNKEWEAIAVHSIRSDGGSETTSNPSNRSLSNTTGAAVKMTPSEISMVPDKAQSVSVKLGADGSAEISGKDIMICGEDITIGQGEGGNAANVNISASETLFLSMMAAGEDGAVPKEDHFIAVQGVAQLYSSNIIYHFTSGAPKPVTPTYDDSELRAQEEAQKEANNQAVADKLIERNREARAKFGKGLLMAALGTALIVCTGGAAAVAVGAALCVFAVADMAEATQSHELAMQGDWSTPATNLLKEVIPDPYYSLIENGLIIAGSIMFAGPAAGQMLLGAGINTGVELAFDLIPDGKLDKSFMEYLDSFSTNLMVSALTGPISKGMDGCSGPWANFSKQFASGFASSTLSGIAQGDLSIQGLAENAIREMLSAGISTKIGFTMDGKNKWLVAGVDTLTDTAFDSASQLVDIALGRQESFDWKRCAQTAVSSAINNLITACDPVNTARGNLSVYKEDLVFAGLYNMGKWSRRYDSVLDHESAFGKGWIHALESFIYAEAASGTLSGAGEELPKEIEKYRIIAMLPDTHKEKFVWGDGQFVPEKEGAPYRFKINPDDTFTLEEWTEEKYKAYFYDRYGRLTAIKNGRNQIPTKIFYVEQGENVPKGKNSTIDHVEYPGGQRLDFTYQDGRIISVTDHAGRTVTYHYQNGRLDYVNYPSGGHQEYTYDENGHLTQLKGEDGRDFMSNAYDRRGRVVCQSYPDGSKCDITYVDQERKTIFRYSDSGREEINYYNDKDEVIRREYGDGIFETMEYDDYGNKIAETDRNGNTTTYKYDQKGHLIEKALPEGLVISYAYDDNGRLIKECDNTGAITEFKYDKDSNLICKRMRISENSMRETNYEHDQYGRLISEVDARGNATKYFYEEDINRPTEIHTAEGYVIRYCYDKAGRRTGIITDYGEKHIVYSETNKVSRETDALGNTTRYLRDSVGNLIKLIRPNDYNEATDNGNGTYYEYDYLDRLTLTKNPDGSVKKSNINMDGIVLAENLIPVMPGEENEKLTMYQYDGRQYRVSVKAPDGGVTYYDRDKNGNLLKQIRPEEFSKAGKAGKGLSYQYDKQNRLTAILDDLGRCYRSFSYDAKGRMIESRDGETACGTKYGYDFAGQLVEKRIPVRVDKDGSILWNVTTYEYDIVGNRILERRSGDEVKEGEYPNHFIDIRMQYDKQNRLIKIEDSLGASAEYTYDCLNKRLTEKYRINEEKIRYICYTYDAAGRLVERMESVDFVDVGESGHAYRKKEYLRTKFSLDRNGNIVGITLPNGGTISRVYDSMDRLIAESLKDEASGVNYKTEYVYDASGKVISRKVVDLNDQSNTESVTTYRYDLCGRLIAEINADGGINRYILNKNGEIIKVVDPDQYDEKSDDGEGCQFTYDIFGRLVSIQDAYGNLIENNNYNTAGRLSKKRDATGLISQTEYDLGGRRRAIYASDMPENEHANPIQTYEYDSLGNVIGITDGEGNRTSFSLDAWGRVIELLKPDGSTEHYTYDYAGNITSTTDGNGNIIKYAFNSFGKTESITDQAGYSEFFVYDHEGNMSKHVDRNGKSIVSKYGSFGYLLSEQGEDGSFRTRKYNGLGLLTETASNYVTYHFDYDKLGRVKTKYVGKKAVLTYEYTKGGKIASITDPNGKITKYDYDKNGKVIRIYEVGKADTIPAVNEEKILVYYSYDEIGRLSDVQFANGVHTHYAYDSARNLASLKAVGLDGNILMAYTYRYDHNGNRTEKVGNKGERTKYIYDSLQRLSGVTYPETGTEKYEFDAAGNRTQKMTDSYVEQYFYDERNRMKTSVRNVGADIINSTQYGYDSQGSLLTEDSLYICKKYSYNDFHQCVATDVIKNSEITIGNDATQTNENIVNHQENQYDGEGLRFSIIENGNCTKFVTNGWENLVELDEFNHVKKRIIRGIGIVASEDNGICHYYHGNERNDIEFITNEDGTLANSYFYDAFGTVTNYQEAIENRYTYSSEVYDKVSEQYYLRKRFYNPIISRFVQEDEFRGDGSNLYAYCSNNPIMYVDPSGYYKASENVFDPSSAYRRGNSTSLKNAFVNHVTQGNVSTANIGSHQAQHLICNEFYNHPAVAVSGYQVDHYENAIMAVNRNSSTPNAMNDFISNNKNYISQEDIARYVTNNTQHGTDGNSSFYHEAYSTYVEGRLDEIATRYGITDCSPETVSAIREQLKASGQLDSLQGDMMELNGYLRDKHVEGIDLYLENEYNTNNKDYYEGGLTKEEAQKRYEEENFPEESDSGKCS